MVSKALKGIATVNLRSLRFSSDPAHFFRYLHELDGVHQSHTISPLQVASLEEILGMGNCQSIFLPVAYTKTGSTPLQDLAALAAMAQAKRPKLVFEIGTFEGLTAVVFIKNSIPEVYMHTLDLPHDKDVPRTQRSYEVHSIGWQYVSGRLIDVFGVRQHVQAVFGDSALFDFTPFRDMIDLFFIDGAHSEDYVILDTCHAFECLAPNGWVVWHDCFNPHVLKALKEIARTVKVLQLAGTNLALAMGKPSTNSFSEWLCKRVHL